MQQVEVLGKRDQLQTLINLVGALDNLKILGADALLLVQIKGGLDAVIRSINAELTKETPPS